MAQGRSRGNTGGANHYGQTNNAGVNAHMNQQGDNRSLFGRTNAEENRQSFSDDKVTSSAREQREDRHDAREQREDRHDARKQRNKIVNKSVDNESSDIRGRHKGQKSF